MNRTTALLALVAMTLAPSMLHAAPSAPLAAVPAALSDASLPWTARRAQLATIGDQLRARAAAHNAACTAVPADNTAQVQSCAQEQAQLNAEIAAYHREVAAFDHDLFAAAPPPIRIGTAAAVRGEVFVVGEDGEKHAVVSGGPLAHDARLTTGPTGHLQILLNDETTFTIGPNSDIVLDRFVYDPDTGAGTWTEQVVVGAFRLATATLGGHRPDGQKVRIGNVADLGIRGTDVEVDVAADGSAVVKLYSGAAVITPIKGGDPTPLDAGQMRAITADGTPGPSQPLN